MLQPCQLVQKNFFYHFLVISFVFFLIFSFFISTVRHCSVCCGRGSFCAEAFPTRARALHTLLFRLNFLLANFLFSNFLFFLNFLFLTFFSFSTFFFLTFLFSLTFPFSLTLLFLTFSLSLIFFCLLDFLFLSFLFP